MKFQIIFFLLLILNCASAQSVVFFGQSDSCRHFTKEAGEDSLLIMKVVDRCEILSVIQQVEMNKRMYSRNGFYKEFYDTAFSNLKKSGYFHNGIEAGNWKEYYKNGKLKYEGGCKIIKVTRLSSNPDSVYVIDIQNADTSLLPYEYKAVDSIRNLTQFHYYPPFESPGITIPAFYSLKDGEWRYYSQSGQLIKREVYSYGKLISNP